MTEELRTYDEIDGAHMRAVNQVAVGVGNAALQAGKTTGDAIAEIIAACEPIDAWRDAQYLRIEGMLN